MLNLFGVMMKEKIFNSLKKLEDWIEKNNYKGYEPFDGLSSFLRIFTFKNIFLERVLQQLVRKSIINIRPLIGITKKDSTKGRGYMAWGYLTMFKATRDSSYKQKTIDCIDWLDKNKATKYKTHSWGNHFDFTSRGGQLPKHEPIIVWTSLIGQAVLDAYEIFKDEKYLYLANSICDWILAVPRERTNTGDCLSYVAYKGSYIHNSNMLGGAMLGRTSHFVKDRKRKEELLKVAKSAMIYSCSRQLFDGSWWYGEDEMYHWIDNFHTGYNLDSLKCYIDYTGDKDFNDNLKKGFNFFKNNFFESDGMPKYYHNKTYPIDSQCASQAIDTLVNFSDYDNDSLSLAVKATNWWIDNMQDKKGYFYFRLYPLGIKDKIPMLHWAQATTYKALTLLYKKLLYED